MPHGALIGYINHRKSKSGSCTTAALLSYRLWDSNPHSFELDFESSASTNSAKSACGVCALKRECAAESREKQNYARILQGFPWMPGGGGIGGVCPEAAGHESGAEQAEQEAAALGRAVEFGHGFFRGAVGGCIIGRERGCRR